MKMKNNEKQRPCLNEELAKCIIERVKEHFTEEDSKEFLYKEVLLSFAPYIFTKYSNGEAMVLMEKLLKK